MALPIITVKPGREKPLRQKHPWVFSGAIARTEAFQPGELVEIREQGGRFLGRGYGNPHSQIRARVLSFSPDEQLDEAFFRRRLEDALQRRAPLLKQPGQSAARLVMSEADSLPGLIVDRYGDWLVIQALSAGMEQLKAQIVPLLIELVKPKGIVERSDDNARELEGLPKISGLIYGEAPPPEGVEIEEHGARFLVDLLEGHKTGFYLDQRESHAYARGIAKDRRVLDCFSFTGGFTIPTALGGAREIVSVDSSAPSLERLRSNLARNGLSDPSRYTQVNGNAFEVLRALKERGETFDMITLDPPKFAANAAQVDKAARAYKDANLLAFKLLAPGGVLLTFSCSGHISADLYQKIVFGAALDSGRDAQIVHRLFQADDHPVLLTFPESLYLKGLVCRVL